MILFVLEKNLSRDFITFTCNCSKACKVFKFKISIEAFDYIFIKFTKSDYSAFLRFYNNNEETKCLKMNVFCIYIKGELEKISILRSVFLFQKRKIWYSLLLVNLLSATTFFTIY